MSLVSREIEFNPVLFNPSVGRFRLLLTLPYQRLMRQSGAARFLLRLALECQGGPVKINVTDRIHEATASDDTPLLWVLRDHLHLTGTKYGCDRDCAARARFISMGFLSDPASCP